MYTIRRLLLLLLLRWGGRKVFAVAVRCASVLTRNGEGGGSIDKQSTPSILRAPNDFSIKHSVIITISLVAYVVNGKSTLMASSYYDCTKANVFGKLFFATSTQRTSTERIYSCPRQCNGLHYIHTQTPLSGCRTCRSKSLTWSDNVNIQRSDDRMCVKNKLAWMVFRRHRRSLYRAFNREKM